MYLIIRCVFLGVYYNSVLGVYKKWRSLPCLLLLCTFEQFLCKVELFQCKAAAIEVSLRVCFFNSINFRLKEHWLCKLFIPECIKWNNPTEHTVLGSQQWCLTADVERGTFFYIPHWVLLSYHSENTFIGYLEANKRNTYISTHVNHHINGLLFIMENFRVVL